MLTLLANIFDEAIIKGLTYFGPKYIENQFNLTASTAGIIMGNGH
jgi:hypothetical protein